MTASLLLCLGLGATCLAGEAPTVTWPDDGVLRVPCWRAGDELIPIHEPPTLRDGVFTLRLPADPAGRRIELRQRGAAPGFRTYEAEDGSGSGTVVRAEPQVGATVTPAHEASGRAYVELAEPGARLDLAVHAAANAVVVRHCIPDAPAGGGLEATLSLLVNGEPRQRLRLSSRHAWIYGGLADRQVNDPAAGGPRMHWDEAWAFIEGGVRPGDVLSLRKGAGDDAAFYRIDLVDLEQVAPPAAPPAGALSIADFGAVPDDDGDDTAALAACVAAAAERGATVWIPPGAFRQSAKVTLDGVRVQGAGMWHSSLLGTVAGDDFDGRLGFRLAGDGAAVSDLMLRSLVHDGRGVKGGKPFTGRRDATRRWRVENVWIMHANVGLWMSGCDDGAVRGCRIRSTYADPINLNRGSSRNLVEECHVRGCGDDGIGSLAEIRDRPSRDNVIRFCTVAANWWGHNVDIAGGSGHVVEDNLLADNALMGVFAINLPSSFPMHPQGAVAVRRNTMLRGGGDAYGQRRGAAWIYAGSAGIDGLDFSDNLIVDAVYRGIHLAGRQPQNAVFARNRIVRPGGDGIAIPPEVTGAGTFAGNLVEGLREGRSAVVRGAGGAYAYREGPAAAP